MPGPVEVTAQRQMPLPHASNGQARKQRQSSNVHHERWQFPKPSPAL